MTQDKQAATRRTETEDILRMARKHSREAGDDLLALLEDQMDDELVRELAVRTDRVELGRWLPREPMAGAPFGAPRRGRHSLIRPRATCLMHGRNGSPR